MKIGYTKDSFETKERILNLMAFEPKIRGLKVFLNLGNSKSKGKEGFEWINKPEAVKKAINKKEMFKEFEKSNIKSIDFIDLEDFKGKLKAILSILRGKTLVLRFENGLNLLGLEQFINLFKSKGYATIKEKKLLEYRIIVFKEKIIRILLKFEKEKRFASKNENCKFIEVKNNLSKKDELNIIKSVKCLGLDLAGVDVLVNKKGEFKIIEVNSGMGLGEDSIRKLFEELKKYY